MRHTVARIARSPISGVYVFVAVIIIFSLWLPQTFATTANWKNIGSSQAVAAIASLGLLLPLAAGAFDLSVGTTIGAAQILVAWLMEHHVGPGFAIVLTLVAGLLIGVTNGLLVAVLGLDSFIATLGTSSLLTALILGVSGDQQIVNLPLSFDNLTAAQPLGIPIPVVYVAVIAVIVWCLLEHTPFGRYLFAIGGSREAARLAGVRTKPYLFLSMVGC